MARVRDTLKAVPLGDKTWDKARKEIAAELDDALGGKVAQRRAELLLRTHVFRGYAAARYRNLIAQVDVFPFWQYKTHGDGNVRPSHAALNGKIFPAGHEIWQTIFPPWDWGCRCLGVPLTQRAAGLVMERGKPSASDAKEAHLLPTQIAKPEMFTAREAELIAKNGRLPNGIPLNRTPTWADSPWSEPGNVKHDWRLIRKRYVDQPEVLKAFENWAKDTEIPDLDMTVDEWIGAEGADTRRMVRAYKKRIFAPLDAELQKMKGKGARFKQPSRNKSRFGFDVAFELGEEAALSAAMSAVGRKAIGQVPDLPAVLMTKVQAFEAEVVAAKVEHAAVWSPTGDELGRFTLNRKNEVEVPPHLLPDNVTAHNHPDGTPPSMRDVNLTARHQPLEVRIATPTVVHRLRPGPRTHLAGAGELLDVQRIPGFDRQVNALDIIATRLGKQNGWSRDMETDMVQQGMLEWLAEQGIIHYAREPR